MKTVRLEDLQIIELKALAYDIFADIEMCQKKLAQVNNQIKALSNEPKPEPPKDKKPGTAK